MKHEALDKVVLVHDVPEHGLRAGDLGAVVEVYRPDELDVEFVTASDYGARLADGRRRSSYRGH